jgi:TolB-like protein
MYQHQHTPLPFEELKGIPPPIIALLEVLLEKDPGLRFQNSAELLKAIPTVSGAIDAGRRITRQSLQKTTSTASRARTRKPPTKPGPEKISVARLPATGSDIFPGKASKPAANATAHKKNRWLAGIGLVGAAAIIGAGAWFLAANKTNESNLSPRTTIPAKSIAVLPFESLSADKQDSYFADGVQDEILNDLAKIAQLTVISRTSVMQYRAGEKRDLRQVANALGVANVLEGTVRRSANRVRSALS